MLFFSLVAVVLLDTTQEEKLEWTRYPFGPEANTPGVSFAINAGQSRLADVVEGPLCKRIAATRTKVRGLREIIDRASMYGFTRA